MELMVGERLFSMLMEVCGRSEQTKFVREY
jgi:hypothetical protein